MIILSCLAAVTKVILSRLWPHPGYLLNDYFKLSGSSDKSDIEQALTSPRLFVIWLHPQHTKYVGVYSFRFSVRLFVRSFVHMYVRSYVRSFVFPSQGQSFCVKVYKTLYFEDPLMDFIHIWHDSRYKSKVFISTIPTLGVTLGSRSRT